jgi:hypothetical protein
VKTSPVSSSVLFSLLPDPEFLNHLSSMSFQLPPSSQLYLYIPIDLFITCSFELSVAVF